MKEPFRETTTTTATTTTNIHQNQVYIESKQRKRSKTKTSMNNNPDETATKISTIESELLNTDNNVGLYNEETLKPRLILRSNEKKRFKLRYRPIEMGDHRQSYTFSMVDNPGTTYQVEINGITSIPRLDMNPYVIFEKVRIRKKKESEKELNIFIAHVVQKKDRKQRMVV